MTSATQTAFAAARKVVACFLLLFCFAVTMAPVAHASRRDVTRLEAQKNAKKAMKAQRKMMKRQRKQIKKDQKQAAKSTKMWKKQHPQGW